MRRLAVPALALLLGGCATGPRYQKPPVATPTAYREPPPAEFKESQGWKTSQPADEAIREKWWEIFGDAELNALEEQVTPSNQTLKVFEARYRQARALIAANRSRLYPNIGVTADVSSNRLSHNRATSQSNIGPYGDFVLPFDVSYEVDAWGRVRRSVLAAREQAQASAADLETVRLSLHAELALNYFELRSLDAQKALLDQTLVAYQKALELTQNRYDGGLASGAEVAQAKTQLETTRVQSVEIGVQRALLEHAIAVLVGRTPEDLALPVKALAATPPNVPTGMPSQLLERRPDIASAERGMAVANEQVGIARTALFPSLMLTATGGFEGSSPVNWFEWPSRFWALGPTAVQTLFDAGRRRATSEAAVAAYDGTVANYRQTVLSAFQDVEDALSTLRVLSEEAKVQRGAVEAAQRSLELALNRYKGGLVTYLEVVSAQSTALQNENTEVDLLRRRMQASVSLIKALGGGWNVSKLPPL